MAINTAPNQNIDGVPETENPGVQVDQTALQIAQILDLDLTGCANPDQGTKLVVDAIYDLIEQYQQCVQEKAETEQQLADAQSAQQEAEDNANDPANNPGSDVDDVDQDGPPVDPENIQQQDQGQNPPTQGQPQAIPSKKSNPFAKKKKPAIAASFSNSIINMAAENRRMKINQLANSGCITGEVARELRKEYVTKQSLTLSLSQDGSDNTFDKVLNMLAKNGPVISYKEQTGIQGKTVELALSHDNEKPVSPLVADAESRSKEVK